MLPLNPPVISSRIEEFPVGRLLIATGGWGINPRQLIKSIAVNRLSLPSVLKKLYAPPDP